MAKDYHPTIKKSVLTQKVAEMLLSGCNFKEVRQTLSVKDEDILEILKSDEYKKLLSDITDGQIGSLKNVAKVTLGEMLPLALRAIKEALQDGDIKSKLQAAGMVLKATGISEETNTTQDASINIIIPRDININENKTIEVKSDKV
jgi:hypothetical protein